MTLTMAALRLTDWQSRPTFRELPVPEPGPGQVLVRVTAAGLCHSDLHVMDASPGALPYELPFTLGHETAGVVAVCGAGASAFAVGDPVVVHGVWSCGVCSRCIAGKENYCARRVGAVGPGLGTDGGLAEYLLIPAERFLVPTHGVPAHHAAPLADAGLTSYHAIKRSEAHLTGGAVVVAIGIGGLGHLAVQIARATSAACIVAVDTRAEALELAERCGADVAAYASDVQSVVESRSGGRGADLVLDFVGSPTTVSLAGNLVGVDSDLTIVGSAGGSLVVGKMSGLPVACRVSTPFWGSRAELDQVMSLAARGLLRPEVTQFPLRDVGRAYDELRAGTIVGRAVAVPDS